MEKRKFVGFLVSKRREEKRNMIDIQHREKIYRAKRALIMEADRRAAATNIQRIYRGYRSRILNRQYLIDRRAFLSLKGVMDKEKKTLKYHLLDLVGLAPHLSTDTPRERVLKLFSRLHRNVAEECISDWDDAYRFLEELDCHNQTEGRFTYLYPYVYRVYLYILTMQSTSVSREYQGLTKQSEVLKLHIRSCTDREQKKILKKSLEDVTLHAQRLDAKVQ